MKCTGRLFIIFLLQILFKNTSGQISINTPLQSYCGREAIQARDSILNFGYGVAGTGFKSREYLGKCPAKFQWGGPWAPIDGYKHTLCGTMFIKKRKPIIGKEKYHFISDGDGDMVFYIYPDSAFNSLLLNSLRPQGHHFKDSAIGCEVAIKEKGNSREENVASYIESLSFDSLQNKPVGVYGAWVSDTRKDNSPEIHPVQQMWMVDKKDNGIADYLLYSLLDNSSRFNDKSDFSDTCFTKAWVSVPLINTFYIPFELSLKSNSILHFDIGMPSYYNINMYAGLEPTVSLIINEKLRLEVKRDSNTFPKITFFEICQTDENTIHGYLQIETSVGKSESKSGAHSVLKIIKTETQE